MIAPKWKRKQKQHKKRAKKPYKLSCCVLLLLLFGISSHAQHMNQSDSPCAKIVGTSDLVACLLKARVSADTELDSLYRKLRQKLNARDAERLTQAQRKWIAYRDANCSAELFLYEGGTASSGTSCVS